jgi:hypothetical protein
VPTKTQRGNDPQHPILSAVRESQTALIEVIRSWTDITEQLTRRFPLPVAGIDVAGAVDRTFDLAEQTLAAQHQLARTLAGVVTRQVDTAAETVDTAVAAVETTIDDQVRRAEALVDASETEQPRSQRPQAATGDTPTSASPRQDRRPDGRTYEERSVEELRERAGELEIEGRSTMTKDELIAALRGHRQARSSKQNRTPDRRSYEERSIEELRDRARQLEIEGRSTMTKDELVAALREHAK